MFYSYAKYHKLKSKIAKYFRFDTMNLMSISVIINTYNSAETIEQCLKSVKDFTQIVIVDMHSFDATVEIASKYTKDIYYHDKISYVEPARNFAISKATEEWILILDSDEEIPIKLKIKLNQISQDSNQTDISSYSFPRKNIIFGSWIKHAGWWPDHKLRFFKKDAITWLPEIHSEPKINFGKNQILDAAEDNAIIHHHYTSVSQWVERMNRYTTVQANEKTQVNYIFNWRDLIKQPLSEFIRRFFVWEGWKDGTNGLGLCLLQCLSEAVVYLKVKEIQKITDTNIEDSKQFLNEFAQEIDTAEQEIGFYLEKHGLQSSLKRWLQRVLP